MNLRPDWTDQTVVAAVEGYTKIVIGAALFGVLLYLLIVGRIDVPTIMTLFGALFGIDRVTSGLFAVINARQGRG